MLRGALKYFEVNVLDRSLFLPGEGHKTCRCFLFLSAAVILRTKPVVASQKRPARRIKRIPFTRHLYFARIQHRFKLRHHYKNYERQVITSQRSALSPVIMPN